MTKKAARNNRDFRAIFVLAGLLLMCFCVAARLYYVQVVLGEHYRVWTQGFEFFSDEKDISERGEIFFAGGQPLAINKEFAYAYASPLKVEEKENAADRVAQILELDKNDLKEKFVRDSLYVLLKDKLSDQEAAEIENSEIDGVYVGKKKMRYYPQGQVAAQIAGFVDEGGEGRYGLEEYYDEELSRGQSIILNIDYNIQYQAQSLLAGACQKLNALRGEAIVADPRTGAVLAMAKSPNFNPNNYKEYARDNIDIFKNDSCQSLFEPGSVFKAITMASALNDGKVTPETDYVDTGMVKIGGWPIYNYGNRAYGRQTMTNVLEHSVNTGAVFAQSCLGDASFAEYIEKFGIFEPTEIDLPETFSSNSEFKKGYAINYATASFGQGIWMTSIQLIRAYSALANGGALIRPSIAQVGRENSAAQNPRQVITPEVSKTISAMLASVVDNGFGKSAKVPGYSIGGKTGTAQMSWSTLGINERGYSDKTTQSFIGFFPTDDPQFLILVKLVAPDVNTAEYSAIPIFNDLAKYVIYVSQLPPGEEMKENATAVLPADSVAEDAEAAEADAAQSDEVIEKN